MAGYKFDIAKFLSRELRDRSVGGQKALLGYLCMITQICQVVGVLKLLGIDKMIEARRAFDIGLIRDAAKPLARPVRQVADMLARLFPQDD